MLTAHLKCQNLNAHNLLTFGLSGKRRRNSRIAPNKSKTHDVGAQVTANSGVPNQTVTWRKDKRFQDESILLAKLAHLQESAVRWGYLGLKSIMLTLWKRGVVMGIGHFGGTIHGEGEGNKRR